MNDLTLHGCRKMAEMIVQTGKWEVVVTTKFGTTCKAFDLTEERAKDWAKFYTNGVARPMSK